jgi:hypothetical protein
VPKKQYLVTPKQKNTFECWISNSEALIFTEYAHCLKMFSFLACKSPPNNLKFSIRIMEYSVKKIETQTNSVYSNRKY